MRWGLYLWFGFIAVTVPPVMANETLFEAARSGNAVKVRELLAQGVDVNAKWRYNTTSLLMAARRGHAEVVKELLDHGADPNARDTIYGFTPLSAAAQNGHLEIVRMLLARNAEGRDQALMAAVGGNNPAMVEAILDSGAIEPATLSAAQANANTPDKAAIAAALRRAGGSTTPRPKLETVRRFVATYARGRNGRITAAALIVLLALVAASGGLLYRASKRRLRNGGSAQS